MAATLPPAASRRAFGPRRPDIAFVLERRPTPNVTMVRLLTLVQKAPGISPGQRFRLEQWAPHLLERYGIALEFVPFESPALTGVIARPGHHFEKAALLLADLLRRREVLALARSCDGVVVYREASMLGPALYERLLASLGLPLIYDFDDAIWLPSSGSVNGAFRALRFPGKTATISRLAGAITVGNEYLAAWVRRHNPNVFLVPTTIELGDYPPRPAPPRDGPFVVGWVGSHSSLVHLESARNALARLGRERQVILRIICDRPPVRPFEGVETDFVPWSREGEGAAVANAHVGIMPLLDNAISRGKCGCKALQYMAARRPVVVSPVGVNTDIVHDGTGRLARGEDEWVAALHRLADSEELRTRLGEAGRRLVEQRYSAEAGARLFAGAVASVLPEVAARAAG
jgi:glycosyltransferase involved in cell wall biosynthesis